ncbi:MAG TPA: hypothetical protein VLN74_01785 [Ilumatobacteraceae bacterium]|nr:hypothetical protein [Ilumatobacteraceae bacterium]
MSVHAWFSNDELSLAPGATLTLPLTVHNLGDETESYTIVPAGLSASWTTIAPGNLTLFGGSQDVIDVTVTPPALSSTTAGPTSIAVRIIPLGDSDDAVVAEVTLVVEPFDDCRIVPLQPIQRTRHRAVFEFMVENHGNTVASCRLHLIDPSERVDGDFDPPAVGVGPGAATLVRLKARARRGGFRRSTRTLDFEVEAGRQGFAPVAAPMAVVQSPTVPGAAIARAAALLALVGAVVLAWFAVVKPTIEDAAADQVDRRLDELAPAAPTDGGTEIPTSSAPPTDGNATPNDGTSTFIRLAVDAPLTQTADQSTTLAEGSVFDMTDIRVENPYNDRGVATLLVNSEPLFIWSLENVRGSIFEPRITPIRLDAGDNVTFSVRCDEIGDTSRSTCTNALNLVGRSLTDDAG